MASTTQAPAAAKPTTDVAQLTINTIRTLSMDAVEAANSGTVAFAGDLGIYGNTVMLDHGIGLFTLYSHLSSIDVRQGEAVERRQVLGKTGETGLAAGDHLHYGVYLHGVAVLPVEWWDPKWIRDNIQPKLDGMSG